MCDLATKTEIETVVSNKVASNEMFTAFDISLIVQSRLKAMQKFDPNEHRHRFLKGDIHSVVESYLQNGYQRVLQDVGAPTQAFVYFPDNADPANYVPQQRDDAPATSSDPYTVNVTPATTVAAVTVVTTPTDGASDDSGDGRKPDARGTICVPNYLVKNAGMLPGDTVIVSKGKNPSNQKDCLVFVERVNWPTSQPSLTTYTVDSYCNVRITSAILSEAGVLSTSYDFDGDSAAVYVHAHD